MKVVEMPKKRDVIHYWPNDGKPIFERHGRSWCASVQRYPQVPGSTPRQWVQQPAPVTFIRLDR